jgi:uncharacterized protein YfaQ (DUF2300 family)
MGGGLMQLVAYGAQDIYLTGNPQITFWKVVYRRHTNFARETIEQTVSGSTSASGRGTVTVSRNGDLLSGVYVTAEDAGINAGDALISTVEVQIGGQKVDKHTAEWMQVWAELSTPDSKADAFRAMTGCVGVTGSGTDGVANLVQVPLQFWFCRNPGLALPLIALQYHEVKVSVTFANAEITPSNVELWADYIYLDTDERRRFAQVSHEYLIEQVQHTSNTGPSIDLNFNHPVKELVWTGNVASDGTRTVLPSGNTKLVLNGHDRFAERPPQYFTQTQVWQHHTGTPVNCADGTAGALKASVDEIAVYSFALKPEEHQPSGTCNFSRIDNAQLKIAGNGNTAGTNTINVYAVNYNVLRVMSGMGGLAYSN